jgi:hypothetical protein
VRLVHGAFAGGKPAVSVMGRTADGAHHNVVVGGKGFAAGGAFYVFVSHVIKPFKIIFFSILHNIFLFFNNNNKKNGKKSQTI